MLSSSLLLLLASAVSKVAHGSGTDAWHMDNLSVLVNEELDPVVNINAQGSHMHKIAGGSAIGASYNFQTYSTASCTSAGVTIDKSNYWMPCM